jgi:hypothetical protein
MVVRVDYLAAVAVEDHHLRGVPPPLPARLAKRVRRERSSVDGRDGHVERLARENWARGYVVF